MRRKQNASESGHTNPVDLPETPLEENLSTKWKQGGCTDAPCGCNQHHLYAAVFQTPQKSKKNASQAGRTDAPCDCNRHHLHIAGGACSEAHGDGQFGAFCCFEGAWGDIHERVFEESAEEVACSAWSPAADNLREDGGKKGIEGHESGRMTSAESRNK